MEHWKFQPNPDPGGVKVAVAWLHPLLRGAECSAEAPPRKDFFMDWIVMVDRWGLVERLAENAQDHRVI
jgi:hypothetical protein